MGKITALPSVKRPETSAIATCFGSLGGATTNTIDPVCSCTAQGTKISLVLVVITDTLANDLNQSKFNLKADLHWQKLLHYHR